MINVKSMTVPKGVEEPSVTLNILPEFSAVPPAGILPQAPALSLIAMYGDGDDKIPVVLLAGAVP
jgi:hypothetical protein